MPRYRAFIIRAVTFGILAGASAGALPVVSHFARSTPPAEPLASVHCVGVTDNFHCWKTRIEREARMNGPKAAMGLLHTLYPKKPTVMAECHQLAHTAGNVAFETFGGVPDAFAQGDAFCWSGYYHGILESAMPAMGRGMFLANADSVCATIPGKERYSFDYYNCVHGLGHGLTGIDRGDIFRALVDCDSLSGNWEQRSCYGGVFMENVMNEHKGLAAALKKDDLLYPCTAVPERYKEECYKMQTSYMLTQNGRSFRDVFARCAVADEHYRDTCAESAGRDASGQTASNVPQTVANCGQSLDDTQFSHCIIGAVKDFISYFHGTKEANALCSALLGRFQAPCRNTITEYSRVL